MPIGYRLFQAATAIVPAGQTLAAAVFAFVFGVVQGLSPLDEPAESVTGRVRISMTVGGHHRRLSRSETRFWGLTWKFPDHRTGRHSICDDPSMPLSTVTALVRNLITVPAAVLRSRVAKDAEVPALRHENAVLRRQIARVRYEPADPNLARRALP
ncbi:hypothetical protein ABT269_39200, partial [Streptomyces viridosporus]